MNERRRVNYNLNYKLKGPRCLICKRLLSTFLRGRKYCSQSCREHRRKQVAEYWSIPRCKVCHIKIPLEPMQFKKYCSENCRMEHVLYNRKYRAEGRCNYCGKTHLMPGSRYCSLRCQKAKRAYARKLYRHLRKVAKYKRTREERKALEL